MGLCPRPLALPRAGVGGVGGRSGHSAVSLPVLMSGAWEEEAAAPPCPRPGLASGALAFLMASLEADLPCLSCGSRHPGSGTGQHCRVNTAALSLLSPQPQRQEPRRPHPASAEVHGDVPEGER